jgi:hypothetical protein
MAKNNIVNKHSSEELSFNIQRKKEWKELLERQNTELMKNDNVAGLAARQAKERDEHNKRFEKMRKDMIDRHQEELEEAKKIQQFKKSDDELER